MQIGDSPQLGHFVSLRDAYGNTYTYAKLGSVAQLYPVLKPHDAQSGEDAPAKATEPAEPRPSGPASAGTQAGAHAAAPAKARRSRRCRSAPPARWKRPAPGLARHAGRRPGRPAPPQSLATDATTPSQTSSAAAPAPCSEASHDAELAAPPAGDRRRVFRSGPNDVYLHPLHAGVRVIAGTVLGHVGARRSAAGESADAHMLFQIRPAGVGAPLIDPKPILDGWVQLENSSIFRAKGQNPFLDTAPTVGQVLLESKEQLEQQVLANPESTSIRAGARTSRPGRSTGACSRRSSSSRCRG